jgi:hypothetical protein
MTVKLQSLQVDQCFIYNDRPYKVTDGLYEDQRLVRNIVSNQPIWLENNIKVELPTMKSVIEFSGQSAKYKEV